VTRVRIAALALLAVAAIAAFSGRLHEEMRDFEVYWTAARRARGAEPLYRASDGHYQFKYLPAFAIAAAPIGALSLQAAKAVWFALSLAALVLFLELSVRHVPDPAFGKVALAALTTLAMAKFYAHELALGQANLLFGALVISAFVIWQRSRSVSGGLLLGVAFMVKPYALLFLPYLLAIGRWRVAAAMAVAAAAVLLMPTFVYGIGGNAALLAEWWRTAVETSAPTLTGADSVSLFALYAKWIGWGAMSRGLAVATIAVLAAAGAVVLAWRRPMRAPELLEVGLVLTAIPLITPQGWDYVFLLSTPLVAVLIAQAPRLPRREAALLWITLAIVAFSIFDIMGRAAYARFMALSIITVCYLVLFGFAVRLRAGGRC
jgi:alpha-1,2-mannosyltransferase